MADTTVQMKELNLGYFPKQFTANGTAYAVQSVERAWSIGKRVVTHFAFRVIVQTGETFELHQCVASKVWTMRAA